MLRSQTLRFLGLVRLFFLQAWYIFSTSQWYIECTKHGINQKQRQKQGPVSEIESLFGPKWASSRGFLPWWSSFSWCSHVFFQFLPIFWRIFVRPCVSAYRAGGPGGLFGAAKNGHLPALRHFLRVDPRSAVHKKRPSDGRGPQSNGWIGGWCCVPEGNPKMFKFGAFLKEIWTSQLLVYIFVTWTCRLPKKFAEVIRGKSQMEQRGNKNEQKAMR